MSEMNINEITDNDVNGAGTSCEGPTSGRCPVGEQRGPGRHPITARKKWSKEVNIVVMECYFRSNPIDDNGIPIKGYRQRMFREWLERGPFIDVTEQRICDQARAIRKNGWLTEVELEMIKRRINSTEPEEMIHEDVEDVGPIAEPGERTELIETRNELGIVDEEASDEERMIVNELREIYNSGERNEGIVFKRINFKRLNTVVAKINSVLKYFETLNITETNNLIIASSVWVAKQLGLKKSKTKGKTKSEPWWKRRIESSIKELNRNINLLCRHKKGEVKSKYKVDKLYKKFKIRQKGLETVIEELKQRVLAKTAKIQRYNERINQYRQNRLFTNDQKKLFAELNGQGQQGAAIPDAEESREFWSGIWSQSKEHNRNAEWLINLKEQNDYRKQEHLVITREIVFKQSRKIPNWKAPGRDGVQGFWIKKLTNLHERIANQLNGLLNGREQLPEWLTYGRTVLCQKDRAKGNAVDNFRPISCLPLMWKLLTGIISEHLYCFLEEENIFPEEQKGCKRKSRGTKDQLLLDKAVLRDCKRRSTNLAMAWIDYRKAYDMIPHSWISECLEVFGVADNTRQFLLDSMKMWKLELTSCGVSLGDVHIKRGIFQGDSLSPLLFVLCMVPLSLVLRKVKFHYEFGDKVTRLNHLLFMDDLKLFAKSYDQIDSLVRTVHMFSEDIGMEFGIKKCGILVLKRGKVDKNKSNGLNLPNEQVMKAIDEEGYKYLGILEYDKIKERLMKDQVIKEYKRRVRLILKSKLNGKNKIEAINTWAVAIVRYGAGILEWRADELRALDRKTRKLLTMYKGLHPKSDCDRLYIARKVGGRGLQSCEGTVRSEENSLGWYLKNSNETLLEGVKYVDLLNFRDSTTKNDFKKRLNNERMENWRQKQMYGQFIRDMPETTNKENTWNWMRKCDLKITTEALICSAQEQAIRTNYVKNKIDRTSDVKTCRLCKERDETISHIVSECKMLAQKEYKRRHDNVAKMVHWKLCEKFELEKAENWYDNKPQAATENERYKVLWDMNIQCDNVIEARRPDIIIVNKVERSAIIIDIAIPGDIRIAQKETEKITKYQDIKREIQRLWNLRKVEIVPVIVGALGSVTKNFEMYMEMIGIKLDTHTVQKTTLLGTARILRKVLEY